MRWIVGLQFLVVLLMPAMILGAPLEDYQSRLRIGVETLQSARRADRGGALERLVWLLPVEEDITLADWSVKVNNTWIHEYVRAYLETSDAPHREAIYVLLQERIAALSRQVDQVTPGSGPDVGVERRKLAEILSQQDFERYRSEGWMSRLRRWAGEHIARMLQWLPSWERGKGPWSSFLEILVWLLAAIVLSFLARTAVRRLHRKEILQSAADADTDSPELERGLDFESLSRKALEYARQGEYRAAIRCLYVALVYELHGRGLVHLEPGMTNRELLESLNSFAGISRTFHNLTMQYDHTWYGKAPASEPLYQEFYSEYELVRRNIPES